MESGNAIQNNPKRPRAVTVFSVAQTSGSPSHYPRELLLPPDHLLNVQATKFFPLQSPNLDLKEVDRPVLLDAILGSGI